MVFIKPEVVNLQSAKEFSYYLFRPLEAEKMVPDAFLFSI